MFLKTFLCGLILSSLLAAQNLVLNPSYEFHSFVNHRNGRAVSFEGNSVAFWNHEAYGDIKVMRESHAETARRPDYSVGNIVSVNPGKDFWQFIALPEARLAHGDTVSFAIAGWQSAPKAAVVTVELMKLDSEDGEWTPASFGMGDKRTFPKHARGEMVVAKQFSVTSAEMGKFELSIPDIQIIGRVTPGEASHSSDINTVGIRISLRNAVEGASVSYWAPVLTRGATPAKITGIVPSERVMEPMFANLPKTMQKLWKGESLHIILMGSSIDRGSANPPMYFFDEDPTSPTFKQPLSERVFDASKLNRPDLDGYFGWWQHFFSYGGRLRMELMRKFNLPVSKICLNMQACDGSCIGEAMSCLEEYCTLSQACNPGTNGHKEGCNWKTLYPELFTRPQGPAPDLVIFGSGANEKTDTPDEGAIFEATIRWIQARYPDTEFLFCVFQNRGGYTPNPGDLQAIALRYQIPFMDYGKLGDDIVRWCNPRALVPRDGHPQAAGHFLWYHTLAKAFECWDPIPAGKAQLHLPTRMYDTTIGWEGHIITYQGDSPRINGGTRFILDDTAYNLWTSNTKTDESAFIDGVKTAYGVRRGNTSRNGRNSAHRWGRCRLGDRHIVELTGKDYKINAIDMKTANNRQFYPVTSTLWNKQGATEKFASAWGAPYGDNVLTLAAGATAEIAVAGTDFSIAYVDAADGGTLKVTVDGVEMLTTVTNVAFKFLDGKEEYLENRKGIRYLPFGVHTLKVTAEGAAVRLLGVFCYDTRPNLSSQRVVSGIATAGEAVQFIPPFKAVPLVSPAAGMRVKEVTRDHAVFEGERGVFTAIGE